MTVEDRGAHVLVVLVVDVPQPNRFVPRTGCKKLSPRAPCHTFHLIFMSLKARPTLELPTLIVPNCHSAVEACTGQVFATGGPGNPSYCPDGKSSVISEYLCNGGERGVPMNCCPKTLNNVDISRKCFKRQSNSPGVSLCKDSFASPLIPLPPPQPYCLVLPACRQNLDQQS